MALRSLCLAAGSIVLFQNALWQQTVPAQTGKAKKPAVDVNAPVPAEGRPVPPRAAGPLKVSSALVAQMEDGQNAESSTRFVPGETVFFSFIVENYKIVGENRKVTLQSDIQAFDPAGTPITEKTQDEVKTSLAEEDKDWKPKFRAQILIPSIAPPGTYKIRYHVKDLQANQEASGERGLEVGGTAAEPSSSLAIRNFGFYRREEDRAPLSVGAYRPGDTLWARFAVVGYKYGGENAIDVSYDVAVQNPAGKEIFAQKEAAVERSKAFYPQPWVPGGINLNLQPDMRPGTYSLNITAHDAIGNQTATERQSFQVQ